MRGERPGLEGGGRWQAPPEEPRVPEVAAPERRVDRPESVETKVAIPERAIADYRLARAMQDEQVREARNALGRTLANGIITVVDVLPAVGDAISIGADIAKYGRILTRHLGFIDLTPDVSKKVALGTEGIDLASFGIFPTHVIESALQFRKDLPRIIAGLKQLKQILTQERTAYEQDQSQIDRAIDTFKNKSER